MPLEPSVHLPSSSGTPGSGRGDKVDGMTGRQPWRLETARPWLWAFVSLLLAAPLFLAEIPPVVDYPNHLARAYVLARLPDDPILSQIFAAHWRILPNLALDLLLMPLVRLLPLHWAGHVVLIAALLAPLFAADLYNRALFGRPSHWPLGGALVAYNGAFLLGLLNFLFAIAAAFAAAAFWLRWRERAPASAVLGTGLGALVVFFCHVTGLALLFVLVLGHELEQRPAMPGRRWSFWRRRLALATLVFVPTLLLFAPSPTAGAGGPSFWNWGRKPLFLIGSLTNYDPGFDIACACYLLLLLLLALRHRWLVMPRSTVIAVACLAAATLLAPYRFKGGAYLDYRFAAPLGLMLFAGMRGGTGGDDRARRIAIGSVIVLFGFRLAALVDAWAGQAGDLATIETIVRPVPPASRVLLVTTIGRDAPEYWAAAPARRKLAGMILANEHLPALYLIQQGVFFQSFFSDPTQQPIVTLPPYRASAPDSASWGAPSYALLGARELEPLERTAYPYLREWWKKFDYVLVMNAGGMTGAEDFLPRCLEPLGAADVAALYRVRANPAVATPADCAAPSPG
jgi:hypothetical protein